MLSLSHFKEATSPPERNGDEVSDNDTDGIAAATAEIRTTRTLSPQAALDWI